MPVKSESSKTFHNPPVKMKKGGKEEEKVGPKKEKLKSLMNGVIKKSAKNEVKKTKITSKKGRNSSISSANEIKRTELTDENILNQRYDYDSPRTRYRVKLKECSNVSIPKKSCKPNNASVKTEKKVIKKLINLTTSNLKKTKGNVKKKANSKRQSKKEVQEKKNIKKLHNSKQKPSSKEVESLNSSSSSSNKIVKYNSKKGKSPAEISKQNINNIRCRSHRVASLNASCKVHLLYESEHEKKGNEKDKSQESKIISNEEFQSNTENRICKTSVKKRKSIDQLPENKRSKRQCSINAAAIIAASYIPDKIIRKRKTESPKSISGIKMVQETKIALSQNADIQIHSSSKNLIVKRTENNASLEMSEEVRNVSSKIRDRLLAIDMMEKERRNVLNVKSSKNKRHDKEMRKDMMENNKLKQKDSKQTNSVLNLTNSVQGSQVTTTECQITEVEIKRTNKSSKGKGKSEHKIDAILGKDAVVRKYQYTKTTNESFVQVGHDAQSIPNRDQAQSQLITPRPPANLPVVLTPSNPACFGNYHLSTPPIFQIPYNQPFKTSISHPSAPSALNQLSFLNLGNAFASPLSSAFTVPAYNRNNPSAFPNYTQGFVQQAGPFIQNIDDPYLIHKPIPYHSSISHPQQQNQSSPHAVQYLQTAAAVPLHPSLNQQTTLGFNRIPNINQTSGIILECDRNSFPSNQIYCHPNQTTANLTILSDQGPQLIASPMNIQGCPPVINLAPAPIVQHPNVPNVKESVEKVHHLVQSKISKSIQCSMNPNSAEKNMTCSKLKNLPGNPTKALGSFSNVKNKLKSSQSKRPPSIFTNNTNQRLEHLPKKKAKVDFKSRESNYLCMSITRPHLDPPVHSSRINQWLSSPKKKLHSIEWSWEGYSINGIVFINGEDNPVRRKCYSAICHKGGDVIKVRDCVLLRSGPKKTDLPFVAKVCALWENPSDGEMMMSLLWYYRPEHTEPGRKPNQMPNEIFASKHRDVNNVACIDDKCYVLTYNEMCRFRKKILMIRGEIGRNITERIVPKPKEEYPRRRRLPPPNTSMDMIFCCRKVYDFRQKRTLKNPM